ncbi:hypothetical protein ACOSQ3_027207 [Xanthoceras sorbifolium]
MMEMIHLHLAHKHGNCLPPSINNSRLDGSLGNLAINKGFGPQTHHSTTTSRSNRLSVMFIKTKISNSIRGSVDQLDNQFVTSEKALASTLIMKLSSQRLTSVKGKLEVDISESFLDKWSINELMTMCVQEEGRLLMEQSDSVILATQGKGKIQANQKGKGKIPPKADIKKESKCFFCKKKGHMKKDCAKFKKWLDDKGNQIYSTIHISNSLQGLQNLRKPVGSEQSILSGNKMGSHVEAIGTYYLTLSSGFVLELDKTFYVPNFSRKLISVSRLVPFGYSFNFLKISFSLFY